MSALEDHIYDGWPINLGNMYLKDDNNITFKNCFLLHMRHCVQMEIKNTDVKGMFVVRPSKNKTGEWTYLIFPNDIGWSVVGKKSCKTEVCIVNQVYGLHRGKWTLFKRESDPTWKYDFITEKEYMRDEDRRWILCEKTMTIV